jgi:hypothetical protein
MTHFSIKRVTQEGAPNVFLFLKSVTFTMIIGIMKPHTMGDISP